MEIRNNLSRKLYFNEYVTFLLSAVTILDLSMKTCCNNAISINRSINLIIDYFSNRLIVAALVLTVKLGQWYYVRS